MWKAAGLLFVAALTASGQEITTRALPSVQFSFGNPGARALGMGGAFLGLADDASAAESNPAGLTILAKPEFSVEFRDSSESKALPLSGTYPDIVQSSYGTRTTPSQVAFASAVLPWKPASMALYYHRVVSFRTSSLFGEPVIINVGPGGPVTSAECGRLGSECRTGGLTAESSALSADLETFGIAAARAVGKFSFGGALRYVSYSQNGMILPLDLSGRAVGAFSQVADGHDFSFSAGVKWRATDAISLGAVYKAGTDFEAPVYFQPIGGPRTLLADVPRHFPTIAGAGLSIRPMPSLTFNADAIRIGYERFGRSVLRGLTSDNPTFYRLDDGTELRFGAEYFVLRSVPIGIRAGWWRDPVHNLQYVGPLNTVSGVAASIVYPRAEAADHYSAGVGVSFSRFQLDAAYDRSRRSRIASVTLVTRF